MNMQIRPIEDLASFVRDLGSECTTLNMGDNILLAGSKIGRITLWDTNTGQEKWTTEVEGPISDLGIDERIYLTASAELHAIDKENGAIEWSVDIGGSSDMIGINGEKIFVTSSLYEIEVQDYTETTFFIFDKSGKLITSIDFEEKPWFMGKQNHKIILGIGRPRCGILTVDGEYNISHSKTDGDSPVNMGIKTNKGFLLGHSNGSITEIIDTGRKSIQCGNDSITAMSSAGFSWQVGDKNGNIFSSDGWRKKLGNRINSIVEAKHHIWVSVTSEKNTVYLLDKKDGGIKHQFSHNNKIQLMELEDDNLAISDEEGKIMFFDMKTLDKRIKTVVEVSKDSERRNLLKKRLRALRE